MNQEEFEQALNEFKRKEAIACANAFGVRFAPPPPELVVPQREDIDNAQQVFWTNNQNGIGANPFAEGAKFAIDFIRRHNK